MVSDNVSFFESTRMKMLPDVISMAIDAVTMVQMVTYHPDSPVGHHRMRMRVAVVVEV